MLLRKHSLNGKTHVDGELVAQGHDLLVDDATDLVEKLASFLSVAQVQ